MSVVSALAILEEQTEDGNLSIIIADVRAKVERGLMLSEAMGSHPTVFDTLYIAMVEAGEAAGALDTVLDRVAIQIEKQQQIKRRVKSAMVYPTLVITFATLVLTGMLLFLVPVFVGIFKTEGGKLPTLTQYIVDASNFLKSDWYILFPAIGGTIYAFLRYKKTASGRAFWDAFLLRVPMKVGVTVLKISMARVSRLCSPRASTSSMRSRSPLTPRATRSSSERCSTSKTVCRKVSR